MDTLDGGFATNLRTPFLAILYSVGAKLGFEPLSSTEAENYFLQFQERIDRGDETMQDLEKKLNASFVSVNSPPVWIQNPDWQFEADEPMIFVGQIEVEPTSIVGDKCFYLFSGKKTGNVRVVIQYG